jgi:hypothetical protein
MKLTLIWRTAMKVNRIIDLNKINNLKYYRNQKIGLSIGSCKFWQKINETN